MYLIIEPFKSITSINTISSRAREEVEALKIHSLTVVARSRHGDELFELL
jgi:radical SAM superfamily enzyme